MTTTSIDYGTEVTHLTELGLSKTDLIVVFDYLFRKITIRKFKDHFGTHSLEVKRRLDRCGYVLLNCKLFAYAHHVALREGLKKPNPRNYEVDSKDARFLRKLDLSHIPKKFGAYELPTFQGMMAEFLNSRELKTYLGKFISKKMKFMIQSYGDTREDLDMTMRIGAMYSIYRMYPYFGSYLHFINIGKGAAKRVGHSMIKNRTTLKNQRLMRNKDGTHEANLIPLDAVHFKISNEDHTDVSLEILESLAEKCAPRVKRFFHLMSGNYDAEFSAFLGCSNSEAALEMRFDVYQAQVQKFLGVTPRQVQRLYHRLRTKYLDGNRIRTG